MKRALHVIHSIDRHFGGSLHAAERLLAAAVGMGWECDLLTTMGRGEAAAQGAFEGTSRVINVHAEDRLLRYSPKIGVFLSQSINTYDLVHVHNLYRWPMTAAANAAHRAGIPFLIQPHGVFSEYYWNRRSRAGLRLGYRRLFDVPNIRRAAGLVTASSLETTDAKKRFPGVPTFEVALGVEAPPLPVVREASEREIREAYGLGSGPIVTFIGRLTTPKGFPQAVEAFKRLKARLPDTAFLVCGPDDEGLLHSRGLSIGERADGVTYAGPVFGERKFAILSGASAMLIPSPSENFCLAALEALAMGVPVVGTPGIGVLVDNRSSPLVHLAAADDVPGLEKALERALIGGTSPQAATAFRARYSNAAEAASLGTCYSAVLAVRP